MSGYPLSKSQMLYATLVSARDRAAQARLWILAEELEQALKLLLEIGPNAEWDTTFESIPPNASL